MLKFRNKMCLAWPSWIQRFCNRRKIPNTSITRRSIQSYAAFFLLRFDFFHWETSALLRIYIFSSSFPKIFRWPWEIYILTNFSSLWQHFSFFSSLVSRDVLLIILLEVKHFGYYEISAPCWIPYDIRRPSWRVKTFSRSPLIFIFGAAAKIPV